MPEKISLVTPLITGLSDLMSTDSNKNIKLIANDHNYRKHTHFINDVTISEFTLHLKNENCGSLFNGHDVDSEFNSVLMY